MIQYELDCFKGGPCEVAQGTNTSTRKHAMRANIAAMTSQSQSQKKRAISQLQNPYLYQQGMTFHVSIPCSIFCIPHSALLHYPHPIFDYSLLGPPTFVPKLLSAHRLTHGQHIHKTRHNGNESVVVALRKQIPFVDLVGAEAGGIALVVRRGLEVELVTPPLPWPALPLRLQPPAGEWTSSTTKKTGEISPPEHNLHILGQE